MTHCHGHACLLPSAAGGRISCGLLQAPLPIPVPVPVPFPNVALPSRCLTPMQGAPGAAAANAYAQNRMAFKLGKALTMAARGSACFDFEEYRERSHDLPAGLPDDKLWEHFVHDGQFEGRHFRQDAC